MLRSNPSAELAPVTQFPRYVKGVGLGDDQARLGGTPPPRHQSRSALTLVLVNEKSILDPQNEAFGTSYRFPECNTDHFLWGSVFGRLGAWVLFQS